MEQVAETLVAGFCRATGVASTKLDPPVDIFELAARVGAKTVDEDSLVEDGRLEDGHRTTRILLRTGTTDERRRFTLAHELGHLVLADPEVLQLARTTLRVEQFSVERMCNQFAAELLMPRRWVIDEFRDRQERLGVIEEVSHRAAVSLSAAMIRLVSVLKWRSSLIYFPRRHDWVPVVLGGGCRRNETIALTDRTTEVLRSICPAADSAVVRALQIRFGGTVIETRGELRASNGGVLCLTRFRPVRG
jgi:IrrE N-terminal-like domain